MSSLAVGAACKAVWDTPCEHNGVYTCGARIEWLHNSQGKALVAARTTVATECADDCAACMPVSPSPALPPPPLPPPPSPPSSPPLFACPSSCCAVLFNGAASSCAAVPVWDFSSWSHPGMGVAGGADVPSAGLCGRIIEHWATRSPSHAAMANPETAASTLPGGAARVDGPLYLAPGCAPSPPAAPPAPSIPPLTLLPPLGESCHVAAGSGRHALGSVSCEELRVDGVLEVLNDTLVAVRRLRVSATGELRIGSAARPAANVTVYLDHDDCEAAGAADGCLDDGRLVSYAGAVHVHGVAKTPWSVLTADCDACATLRVAECAGWAAGDRIAVAPTGHRAEHYAEAIASEDPQRNFLAAERVVRAVTDPRRVEGATAADGDCVVELETPLDLLHRGAPLHGVPTHAEVLNLDRSVTITGPPIHWRDEARPILGGQGITTVQVGGGLMKMEHARVDNCGRVALGEYCVHLHLVGECEACVVRGIAVERALNKAITVHGTHGATVERNVVYDVRGAGIYIEDGNELRNTIAHNAILCPSLSHKSQIGRLTPAEPPTGRTATGHRCALKGVPSHSDSDYDEQSGIYLLSPTNDVIGNHVVGMENAFYVNHQGGRSYGIGAAYGRVCILSSPFGR